MKVSSFLILLVLSINSLVVESIIPAPKILRAISFDPDGIKLQWKPVESPEGDPIIGYRMKVWELSKTVYTVDIDENGESKTIEKKKPIKDRWSFDHTKAEPKWIIDVGPEATEAEVNGISFDIFYELRVQAVTKSEEGALSDLTRLAVRSSK